jgi:predicted DNA-binding transcriptional regulator AlpA
MAHLSTRQAAKKLGISMTSLGRYIAEKKVPAPKATIIGRYEVRAWSEEDIERVRALLPKIANGRETRYSKLKKQAPKKEAAQTLTVGQRPVLKHRTRPNHKSPV